MTITEASRKWAALSSTGEVVPRSTIRSWLRLGLIPGARQVKTPGMPSILPVWYIPDDALPAPEQDTGKPRAYELSETSDLEDNEPVHAAALPIPPPKMKAKMKQPSRLPAPVRPLPAAPVQVRQAARPAASQPMAGVVVRRRPAR